MTIYIINGKRVNLRPPGWVPPPKKLTQCQASRGDGECVAKACPQTRDGEPMKSGRTCPLPWDQGDE